MEYQEFEKMFLMELKKNHLERINNIESFYQYMKLLLEWNDKINLTSITDEKEFIQKHFIDSLTIQHYMKENMKIIDIGTGAGFPGIPIKLIYPNLEMTLIDSVGKKVNVSKDVMQKVDVQKIEAIHTRAEDYAKENREKYDIAVSRAVANMNTLVEYLIPFVKVGGRILCMKGPNCEEELESAKKAIDIMGGKIETIENFFIDEELERNIVVIKKIKETPIQYPRGQGKPLKNPIE